MSKESISNSYIEDWHRWTASWLPDDPRSALVIGSDRHANIGAWIAEVLRSDSRFVVVDEENKETLNAISPTELEVYGMGSYDTLVLANGRTNIDWFEHQPTDEITQVMQDKLIASMMAARQFVRSTLDQEHLKYIVFIGSMAHRAVLNGSAVYCAASAGLNHFASCLAWELAPKGYRVFCVNPSNTADTPMTEKTIKDLMRYRNLSRDSAERYWGSVRALPRWLHADNIGEVVKYLVTDRSAEWLAGNKIDLGGGLR